MTEQQMNEYIEEAASSLAVEGMIMTDNEKENLRKIGRGELTFSELINRYIAEAKEIGRNHA
ncbi:hypothetical protein [Eggerthella sp. YY7918]|uniref:hypothetical protein n=1 Tax=Eggerthella sp. (strain YY7918) TaxID=502558 RepID=UPI00021712EA|nr:hypothetical protein [Eggerthella sp. YY7918]BAK44785.1 hypothetical protein EGYY_16450 [Eggerthella sp. YY7918]